MLINVPCQGNAVRWLLIVVKDEINRASIRLVLRYRFLLKDSQEWFLLRDREGSRIFGPSDTNRLRQLCVSDSTQFANQYSSPSI
jgi:hypothetical protein